jgi:multidrug efflux pump subunit AcrA (membrane-fusion protein)
VNPRIKSISLGIAAFALGGILTSYFLHRHEQPAKEESKAETSRLKHGTNGETIVTLDAKTQKRIGLKVANPAAAQWQPEVTGYGRVLDPAPLAALMTDLVQAHVAMETSQGEFERLRTLAEQNNASVRALQAAEAAAKRDQVQVDSLRTKLALGWGKAILEREDPPTFVRSLTTGEHTLVRIDLPAGESLKPPPASVRLVSLGESEPPVAADFFDTTATVDPQTQGQGFLLLLAGKPSGFSPNAAVTGYVKVPGDSLNGVTVPRDAVIRHQGKAWIYVQSGDEEFTRREVSLDHPTESGWFVPSGVTDKDRIIVGGAQTILSIELSSTEFKGGARD